jgi:hypothetical protein
MRGFGSICTVLVALLFASGARAAEPSAIDPSRTAQTNAAEAGNESSGNRLRAVVTGLRQSLGDTGLSQALTRAGDWVKELEVSWTAHRNGGSDYSSIDTETKRDVGLPNARAAVAVTGGAFAAHPYSLNLGLISFEASGAEDQVWALGHAQPLASLGMGGSAADPFIERNGRATGERSLASHDLEIGLRVPTLPWNATIAADRYWWGLRGFGPQVQGTRVALKLSPMQHVEIEGGRSSDTRGSGGFIGLLYRVPLDRPQ